MLLGGCYLLPNSEQASSNPNSGFCFASVYADFSPNISPVGGSSIVVSEVPENSWCKRVFYSNSAHQTGSCLNSILDGEPGCID